MESSELLEENLEQVNYFNAAASFNKFLNSKISSKWA